MFSDKQFGLPGGLVAAAKAIMEAKHDDKDKDDVDAKKMKGGKTKVDLNPETDDQSTDSDDMKKKSMKEGKEHTIPKTEKEKKLAALASPKDKITHKDVLFGRGVVKEEDIEEKITPSELRAQLKAKAAAATANKPKEDDIKEAKAKEPKPEMPKKKLDFTKINAVRMARKAAKSARHGDTSHLPPGWSTTFHREDVDLTDEELERLEAIAQELDEAKPTIVSAPIRGANQDQSGENTKSTTADYTIYDSKKMKKEEVELDEAKRGRPRKNPAPGETPGEEDEHEHVIMQLRKVVSTHGALPVKHLDGKSTKMTPQLAQHALNKHNAMKTAAEKQDFEQKLHKSHDSMKSALGQ